MRYLYSSLVTLSLSVNHSSCCEIHLSFCTSVCCICWKMKQCCTVYSPLQHAAAPRSTTQHHAAPRSTTQHHAAPRSITQHHATSHSIIYNKRTQDLTAYMSLLTHAHADAHPHHPTTQSLFNNMLCVACTTKLGPFMTFYHDYKHLVERME